MTTLFLARLLPTDVSVPIGGTTVRAVWLADLYPDQVRSGTVGRFVFVPDSQPDEIDGHVLIDAAGPPGVLRTVQFAKAFWSWVSFAA
jgi:hypothetical protein